MYIDMCKKGNDELHNILYLSNFTKFAPSQIFISVKKFRPILGNLPRPNV